jgi:hypothetical protein
MLQLLRDQPDYYLEKMLDRYDEAYSYGDNPDVSYAGAFDYISNMEERFSEDTIVRRACRISLGRLAENVDSRKAYYEERQAERRQKATESDWVALGSKNRTAHSSPERNIFSDVDGDNDDLN